MPRRIAGNHATKAEGIRENVRVRGDDAVLSGINEADNPKFDRYTANGTLEGVMVTGPLEEVGFTVYDQGPGATKQTQQGFAPISAGLWDQSFPLVSGNSPPDTNRQSRVTPYTQPPILEAIPDTRVGLSAGWHGVTWCYAMQARTGGSYLVTEIAPLHVLFVAQNQGLRINLDIDVSESIPYIVFGITPPYATEIEAANSSTVYFQHVISTRPRVPAVVDIWGPYKRDKRLSFLSSGNETYIQGIPPKPSTRSQTLGHQDWLPQLAYSFNTPFGRSLSSEVKVQDFANRKIFWKPPSGPPQMTSWNPEWVDSEGNWRSFGPYGIFTWAELFRNIPDEITTASHKVPIDRNEDDNTSGVPGPDSALSNVTAIGKTLPAAGTHKVRITKQGVDPDGGEQEESAPSPQATLDVPSNNFLRVRPPAAGSNLFPNPEATRVDATTGLPEEWEHPASSGVTYTEPEIGKQRIADVSGSTASQDVFRTPRARIIARPDATAVLQVEVSSRVTGRVDLVVKQINGNLTTSEFTVAQYSTNATNRAVIRFSDTGVNSVASGSTPAHVVWNADVAYMQLIVRHIGSGGPGVRNLTTTIWNLGGHLGWAHPAKRVGVDPVSEQLSARRHFSLSLEPPASPYPGGGYAVTVINPPNSQRAYMPDGTTFVPGNMVEYYGVAEQPLSSAFFLSGMAFATRASEQRTVSAHIYWEGVGSAATPLRLLLKNAGGGVVLDLGGFVTGVTGDSRAYPGADANGYIRAPLTFVAPEGAVIAEISSGTVGDGLFRVMGVQYEYGAQATEFTDEYPTSGSLISVFDFGIPGVESGQLETLNEITRVVGFGADVTHATVGDDIVTSHLVLARSKHEDDEEYSPFTDDPSSLWIPDRGRGTVQIGTILSTNDPTQTPVLHAHYIDFERVPGGSQNGMTFGSFCRGDGSEFDGTATAYNVPILTAEKPMIEEEFADASRGVGQMGPEQNWLRGFGVEFYLQSAAEECIKLVGSGLESDDEQDSDASVFEIWIQNRKYRVRITTMDIVVEDREAYLPLEGLEHQGRWLFRAEEVEGEVLSVEDL